MATSESKIEAQPHSDGLKKLAEKNAAALAGGGTERVDRQHAAGKMTARERVEFLLDDGTFEEFDRFKKHRSLDFGMYSGQVVVAVKSVSGAKSYFIRYAVMNGTTPGPWTTVPAATIRKPITVSGLTPITMYGFQVQALGVLGYSDWSTTETIVVN